MSEGHFLLRVVRHNGRLKIFAILLALISWFLVREETSYEQTINGIPLILVAPDGSDLAFQSLARVSVRFAGARADVSALSDENVEVRVELKDGAKPTTTVRLSARHVRAPPGVRALRVEPTAVTARIEKKPAAN